MPSRNSSRTSHGGGGSRNLPWRNSTAGRAAEADNGLQPEPLVRSKNDVRAFALNPVERAGPGLQQPALHGEVGAIERCRLVGIHSDPGTDQGAWVQAVR